MLGPARVLVHGAPVVHLLDVEGALIVVRGDVPVLVPGGVHEGIHGVRLPLGLPTAPGAPGPTEPLVVLQGGLSRGHEVHVLGQQDRQVLVRHGHRPAPVAVHDGDGGTPVPLPADEPVPQAVVHRPPAPAGLLQPRDHLRDPLRDGRVVEGAGVHHAARALVRGLQGFREGLSRRLDHHGHGQPVLAGELEVPLVVGRHSHDGAGAVSHEDVVCDPDGDPLPVHGVGGVTPEEHPRLLPLRAQAIDLALPAGLVGVRLHLRLAAGFRQDRDQGVFGGQDHEGGAPQGVGPGGEHHQGVFGTVRRVGAEGHLRPLAAADPVALHGDDALRPLDPREVQELVRVLGDAEEPLLEVLLDHRGLAPFAPAVLTHHLFPGQGGVAVRAPVHGRQRPVRQPRLVELQEEPLVPLVVLGLAGHDLPGPVEHGPHGPQLAPHALDVPQGPPLRVDLVLDGRVLRGQAEGVEPDGEQHVVAPHAPVPGGRVAGGHGVPVADVQVPAGVRVHGEEVELRPVAAVRGAVQSVPLPPRLPLGLCGLRVVPPVHASRPLLTPPTASAPTAPARVSATRAGPAPARSPRRRTPSGPAPSPAPAGPGPRAPGPRTARA
ncbi:hypothetical protein HRbin32_01638 [bacterium HR32]|nr:hypothetical protein HRbin32_01638 [bacterium HR32]